MLAALHTHTRQTIDDLRKCPIECNVTNTARSTVMNKIRVTSMESITHND